ncbi:MAG: MBL fold metallo-hydrolase [Gammaproteobacteria bacterium]
MTDSQVPCAAWPAGSSQRRVPAVPRHWWSSGCAGSETTRCGVVGLPSVGGVRITELRPHLYRLVLGRYQAYLWHDDDSVTLIDTGEAGSGPAIDASLRQLGLAPGDLDRLVLTHFHDDHTGSAAEVSSWGAVQVIAHAADAPVIRGDVTGPPPNFTDIERALHARIAAVSVGADLRLVVPDHRPCRSGRRLEAAALQRPRRDIDARRIWVVGRARPVAFVVGEDGDQAR